MIVVLHFPSLDEAPIGVWWREPDRVYLSSHYAEERPDEVRGRQTMAEKVPGVSWEDYFHHLRRRVPYFVNWEVADIGDAWSPKEYLEVMRRVAAKRLAA